MDEGVLTISPDRHSISDVRQRRKLAKYLRDMADAIESDMAEVQPETLIVILVGPRQNQVSWSNLKSKSRLLSAMSDFREKAYQYVYGSRTR